MKYVVLIVSFCLLRITSSVAQEESRLVHKGDSLRSIIESKGNLQARIDSFQTKTWSDSLRYRILGAFDRDSLVLKSKIDSCEFHRLSPGKYLARLDSIKVKRDQLLTEVVLKKEELTRKSTIRLEQWKKEIGDRTGLPSLPSQLKDKALNGNPLGSNVLEEKLMTIEALGLPDIPQFDLLNSAELNLSPSLSDLNSKIAFDAINIPDNVIGKGGDLSKTLGSLGDLAGNPEKILDGDLIKINEIEGLKEQVGIVEELKNSELVQTVEKIKDPEAAKTEVIEMVKENAIDHFAGKEAVLQQAMDKISKYKQQYSSIQSLSDIGKRPPNPMKGKQLRDRLVPGVSFQFLRKDDIFLDITPYIGYRFSGRITSGLGWNQRLGYSLDHAHFTSVKEIYGPRVFSDIRGWKGFSGRVEFDYQNSFIPPLVRRISVDNGEREWVFSVFVGIKKEYQFYKKLKGTAFILFNVYNEHYKSPYGDVVNSRFGFEFKIKQKDAPKASL